MKKILFLGAGFLQSFAIQRARELGYYTIAIDELADSVGFDYANQRVNMSVNNIEGCLAVAQINQVDGVMNSYLDSAMITAAHIVSRLDLPGISPQVAESIKNRFTLTSVLQQSNINQTEKVYLLSQLSELNEVMELIHFPVLVKSLGPGGQRGLTRKANNVSELYSLFKLAQDLSETGEVIVEDYMEGHEYSIEAFVFEGEVQVYGVMEKIKSFQPEYVEVGYRTLARLPDELAVQQLIERTVKALKIDFGSFNIELITTQDGVHHIVKVKPGVGGSVISSHIIPKVLRYNYIDNAIRASVNDPFDQPKPRYAKNVVTRKLDLQAGHRLMIEDLSAFEKDHHIKLYYRQATTTRVDEQIHHIDKSLYIIGAEDSLMVAEENVNRISHLIQERYIERQTAIFSQPS